MKRVTSFDVAKQAGVSRSVVSAVLNGTPGIGVSEEKRRAVLKAIEELGYVVDVQAQGMRTGRSRCIAAYGDLSNRLFSQMLQGLQLVCNEQGYYVLLCGAGAGFQDRSALIDLYLQRRIDGIVTKDVTGYSDPEWEKLVREKNIPFVSVEGFPESGGIVSVQMDYGRSIRIALDYIRSRTPLPPAYIEIYEGAEHRPNWGDRHRTLAYKQWMEEKGLEPRVVLKKLAPWPEDHAWWTELLRADGGAACYLTNWSRGSVLLYRAANELGLRIGRDVLVMAADNTERVNAQLVPSLSAVEVPYKEMGEAAARRLIAAIEGAGEPDERSGLWLEARLEPRESL
ncbi:LacI family DNA-binding transcriptional regulator [Paenibacillus filicis]|uniref:LacI family DNA-binding transcriptional regulator n=1 Tax=Paenibacillus gyeongsangnamensis TaxID=3388067 RepID=A0ABT4QHL9_9BACL|nr:LacI family DNA-binding transcriptional regulator [Paenibacillus filicis]MCZ8516354.1 LacI family DNA-binding transcriptional regulator [Paenibacillus filicis]